MLAALLVLVDAGSVAALDPAKPSQPLDLLSFARARRGATTPRSRPPAVPAMIDGGAASPMAWAAEDTLSLITGAVPNIEATPSAARPTKPEGAAAARKSAPRPRGSSDNDVTEFCGNVADPAVDARLAWQLKELEKAESLLRERIAEVEAKRAEYEKWMALRDEFLKKAEASVVEIYSRMRPEAAAVQIAGMADETAAAVLAKLSPKSSSAIFNEMDAARAANLANILGGMRRVDDGKTNK